MSELTEREKAIKSLEKELSKAAKSRAFVDSESGQFVLSYIGELISGLTNQILNSRKTEAEYIELRGQIDILRKLKQVIEVQSNDDVMLKLRERLDLASSGE